MRIHKVKLLTATERTRREALAATAQRLLADYAIDTQLTTGGLLYNGFHEGRDSGALTLLELERYIIAVRNADTGTLELNPRGSLREVLQTIRNLGVDDIGKPVNEEIIAVLDLELGSALGAAA